MFNIGSMNMYKFSYRKDKEISKDLSKIANVIVKEEFDIVALQEVLHEQSLKDLVQNYLGDNWKYVWEAPKSKSIQASEGYAFIWNSKRFRLATSTRKEEKGKRDLEPSAKRQFNARIHENYSPDRELHDGKLIRNPLYARFESVYGWYEIRLINTHIIFRESDEEKHEGDKQLRKRELQILSKIYDQIEDKVYRNARKSYTFLLGDYNLSLSDIGKVDNDNTVVTRKIIDRDNTEKIIITVQHQLSTLKSRSPKEPDKPAYGYANNYDHFTYNEKLNKRLDMNVSRIDSVKKYWNDDFEEHRKEFSDHVPIKLICDFK